MNSKAIKRQLLAAIAMVLVAALALGSSTFAWFVNNSRVTAETADVTAATADYLLISSDGTNFGTSMALDSAPVTLTPVSITDDNLKSATPSFYKVKNNDQKAWVADSTTGNVPKANVFETAATTDYFHDTFYLKSSTASAVVQAKITATPAADKASHAEEAMYVAFVPVSGSTYGTPIIYQLAGTNNANTTAGANTYVGDTTTGNYTTKGIKSIQAINGTLAAGDMGDLTISNTDGAVTELTFTTLTDADTSYQFEVYVWMEGTDPQCYNTVASGTNKNANVKISLEFYTGAYPAV